MANDEKRFSKEKALVNTYMAKHPGMSYRESILNCLNSSEGLEVITKGDYIGLTKSEILRSKKVIDELIYNLSLCKKSDSFNKADQDKLDKAYSLVKEVGESIDYVVKRVS